jgi:hypothetical protein
VILSGNKSNFGQLNTIIFVGLTDLEITMCRVKPYSGNTFKIRDLGQGDGPEISYLMKYLKVMVL